MNVIELNVKGMMCEGCENRIINVVRNIEGVDEVRADYKEGKVIVKTNNNIKKEAISEVINDIGYKVVKDE